MRQWHPLFAEILRLSVEDYFDVQVNMPVGDLPREADVVLVRRASDEPLPFQGIWKHLVKWNVIEFKGPTVTPRPSDLEFLVELGLGIERHLNAVGGNKRKSAVPPEQTSFWMLVNTLGQRTRERYAQALGGLVALGSGVWKGAVLRRPVYLVSRTEVAVEPDSIPLHLLAKEPVPTQLEVGRLLLQRDDLWNRFGEWFATLHADAWKEIESMAATRDKAPEINLEPLLKYMSKDDIQRTLKRLLKDVPVKRLLKSLSAQQLQELKKELK